MTEAVTRQAFFCGAEWIGISLDMYLRFSAALGATPGLWLRLQMQ